jgi:hypothetical protein
MSIAHADHCYEIRYRRRSDQRVVRDEIYARNLQAAVAWLCAHEPEYTSYLSYSVFYSWGERFSWE